MSLSLSVYRKVELLEASDTPKEEWDEKYDGDWVEGDHDGNVFLCNIEFPERSDGLPDGLYRFWDARATLPNMSCSTFNRWRGALASAMGMKIYQVWAGGVVAPYFQELLYFSDSSGFLGPKTCAKLYQDFTAKEIAVQSYGEWFTSVYQAWKMATGEAMGSGAIRFH